MTGLEIYEQTKTLAAEIEKNPRWSLAWVLASHVICRAAFLSKEKDIEEKIKNDIAALKTEINGMNEAARQIARGRRFEKLNRRYEKMSKKYGWGKGENHETDRIEIQGGSNGQGASPHVSHLASRAFLPSAVAPGG